MSVAHDTNTSWCNLQSNKSTEDFLPYFEMGLLYSRKAVGQPLAKPRYPTQESIILSDVGGNWKLKMTPMSKGRMGQSMIIISPYSFHASSSVI